MQNWNQQWQVSAGATAGPMPQPPTAPGYPTAGTDPMATMQANMQYFNQPAPSGYTAEQWAAAQQQNWTQWQQYQQQYQQWQAQYGAKYQETIKQMSASGLSGFPLVPPVMPPPLPKDDCTAKPPLPPDNTNLHQSINAIPPHQNNLPLFSKTSANPPLPLGQPPPPPDNPPPSNDNFSGMKRSANNSMTSDSAKKLKSEDDELSHAEKRFDAQFKEWEEQFNKWKLQNANHPDKAQYKQYEAKWTSWREKLIERREQMRKNREAQRAKAESEKKKSLPGSDKLLNILTNTENQGLINNLLGIGKTLGLSGKENKLGQATQGPSPSAGHETSISANTQSISQSAIPNASTTMTSDMTQHAWAAQQWAAQYNMTAFPTYQPPTIPPPVIPNQPMIGPNFPGFNQMPPLSMTNPNINFSQPPPGFPPNSQPSNSQVSSGLSAAPHEDNSQYGRNDNMTNAPFNRRDQYNQPCNDKFNSNKFESNDNRGADHNRGDQFRSNDSFARDGADRFNQEDRNAYGNNNFRRDGPLSRDLGKSGLNHGPGNDSSSGDFYGSRERSNDRNYDSDRYSRNEGRFNDSDQYGGPNKDSFNSNIDRDQSSNDRFRPDNRFSSSNPLNDDRFNNPRFGSGRSSSNDRFADKFNSNQNRLESRDNFGTNNHNIGKSNNRFEQQPEEMPAELKKLMEKRRAAMDVFKPSSNFLAPEKSNTNFGSLSESFKKITGDSPFLPKDRFNEFGRDRGPGPAAQPSNISRGSGAFGGPDNRLRDDFRDRGQSDIRSRGLGDFDTRLDSGGSNRPNDFGPRGNNIATRNQDQDMERNRGIGNLNNRCEISPWEKQPPQSTGPPLLDNLSRGFGDFMKRPGQFPKGNQLSPQSQPSQRPFNVADDEKNREPIVESEQNIPPLEIPPWMDPQMMKNPIIDGNSMNSPSIKELQLPRDGKSLEKMPGDHDNNEPMMESTKKQEGLPFMGENDPKPEDLNMEPPPELPDLGPVKGPNNTYDKRESLDRSNFFGDSLGAREMPFKSRESDSIGAKLPDDNRFQPPSQFFAPRGMNNQRGNAPPFLPPSCGPNDGPFGLRNFNEPPFNQRGFNEQPFGQRGPHDGHDGPFGQRGPHDGHDGPFSHRDSFSGPFDRELSNLPPFGHREGPEDRFGPRGLNQGPGFGPLGTNPNNFPQRDGPFGPRGFDNRSPFRPQGPDELFMPRGQNDMPFNSHPGNTGPRNNIPSLLSFKFDAPVNLNESQDGMMPMNRPMDRPFDRPFRNDSNRPPFGPYPMDERDIPMRPGFPGNEFLMGNDKLGPVFGPGPMPPPRERDQPFERSGDMPRPSRPCAPMNSMPRELPSDVPSALLDYQPNDRDPFSRRPTNHPGYRRTGPMRPQFCIGKQFNYNHGGGEPAEIFTEFLPSKVIEYGNVRRPTAENYVTPIQCFDYGHGNIKPNVIEHDIYPRMEFNHWVECEQNEKEYNDSLKAYEDHKRVMKKPERRPRRELNPVWRYEDHKKYDEPRPTWERSEKPWREPYRNLKEPIDYKSSRESRDNSRGKRRREKSWDKEIDTHRHDRPSRSNSEDRTREKNEKIRKDSNTEYSKNDERSKGNVSRQENPMNNPTDSTIQESSNQDVTNITNEPPKTMELAKPSNITMVDDLLCSPGRQNRPPKITIILRGPPGSGKSFVAKLIKDKELEQGGSAPRILSLDDYFLTEKEVESKDDNGKKIITKEMVYEYEEAMESSYISSLVKAFKKNITDGYFNFIILDCINEKIADYEEMWSFAKTKGFRVYVCEMEMDVQVCLKRNVHKRTEDEINKIVDYFEPTPSYHQILDVASLLQEQAIQEVEMEEAESIQSGAKGTDGNDDSQDSQEDQMNPMGVSKWEKMEAEDKLDRLDGLAKRKNEGKPQTMEDFLQVPDYYNMEDTSGKKRVRWADLEERKEQEKMRAVGFVVGQTNWNRMLDPTKGGSALTRTKLFDLT